jgi:uncharacterized OsmC-like protein
VEGDIEAVDGVIRISRMRVKYHLKIPAGKRPEAERALQTHPSRCPAAVTLGSAVAIEYSWEIQEEEPAKQ